MTNEEAIKYLKDSKCDVDGTIDEFGQSNQPHEQLHNDMLDLAIKALEKQIPKKQKSNCFGIIECLICSRQIEWLHEYCPKCGHAISGNVDWTDTE